MPQAKKRTFSGVVGGLLGLVGLSAVAGVLVTATVTPAIAVGGYAASSAISVFENMPSYLQIDKLMLPTEIYAENEDGDDELMAEFYDQNRIPVTWDEVNPLVYDAVLSSEDKNFYSHGGVDLLGTLSALAENLTSSGQRGASSITQQYVKNVRVQNCEREAVSQEEVEACFNEASATDGSAGLERKAQEMRYAIQIEKQSTKNEILLGYLNIASFGGDVYGIGAAAEYYFGVSANDLTLSQAAALAGIVKAPNFYRIDLPNSETNGEANGYAETLDRRNYVLYRMYTDGKISEAEYTEAREAPIEPKITPRAQGCSMASGAEYFCDYVRTVIENDEAFGETAEERTATLRRGGLKVYTTLDPDLQSTASEAMEIVPSSVDYMELGSSAIQVEVGTGRVLSMVQNTEYTAGETDDPNKSAINFNVRQANNGGIGWSAGSTYKTFSLVNWLEQGKSANAVVNGRIGTKQVKTCGDDVQEVPTDNTGQAGHVGNFEQSPGYVGTVKRFTADSLNSGFLAMAEQITVCSTNEVAMKMGVTRGDGTPLDDNNEPYNVLGSSNVAPIDMAAAYAAIAANGILCEPKAIDRVTDSDGNELPAPETTCERVMTEAVASTSAWVLESVMDGTGVGAKTYDGTPIFGKTGIHEYEHTWMDGASTEVASVVWVGNVEGRVKLNGQYENGWQLSRIRNAIWPEIQRAANAKYGGEAFPGPDDDLTRQQYSNLPNVIGRSVDDARTILTNAGFTVVVGSEVDSGQAEGTIAAQDPGAGRVIAGSTVTIRPSNGDGVTVPSVGGSPQDAESALRDAGFTNIGMQCNDVGGGNDDEGDNEGEEGERPDEEAADTPDQVTGTSPGAGESVNRNDRVTIQYDSTSC